MYIGLKHSHLLIVVISVLLFQLRYFLKLLSKPQSKFLKIAPHIVDTLLLVSGITLAIIAGIKPWEQLWLGYKLVALILYIVFGTIALKSHGVKSLIAYMVSTLLVAFMVFTALSKSAWLIG